MEAAAADLEKLTEYGTVGDPDRYEMMRACGAMDAKGHRYENREYKRAARVEVSE